METAEAVTDWLQVLLLDLPLQPASELPLTDMVEEKSEGEDK